VTLRLRTSVASAAAGALLLSGLVVATAADPQPGSAAARRAQATAQPKAKPAKPAKPVLEYPPRLPGGQTVVVDSSPEFLKPTSTLKPGVAIAQTPPTVEFQYYPGQNYPGQPWSNWGDSLFANGKYYSAIGDHLAIGSKGTGEHGNGSGRVFEYDPKTKALKLLVDTTTALKVPAGHYQPGKIHSRLDLGRDGWLYFATHRGSGAATADAFHYQGDWILRTNPATGVTESVVQGPVPKHALPTSVLDPERLIFYGSTAHGVDAEVKEIHFFAYDVRNRRMLHAAPGGPARAMIFARSTGRVYFVPGAKEGKLMRFDPAAGGAPVEIDTEIGIRAATEETPQGKVYTVSLGQGTDEASVWEFDVRTEKAQKIGTVTVGGEAYVATIDADPTGRWLYYIPGAHGGSEKDGSAVVQFDVKTKTRKVVAFLHPFYQDKYGATLKGTYGVALDDKGEDLYVTWNVSRGSPAWDTCGLTVIHLPASERQP
jgi:hypothetical protein